MTQHLLTGAELSADDIHLLIEQARQIKQSPKEWSHALQGKHLAMLFDKPSLRTRFSFAIAMQQLGGHSVEAIDVMRKDETAEDLTKVLQAYCDAVMIRTFNDEFIQRMANVATVPIINGLTDLFHPCQIFADLMTLQEQFSKINGLTLSYIGDGNNILHSLLLIATRLGVNIHYCCPQGHGPDTDILQTAIAQTRSGEIKTYTAPKEAVCEAQAVYTDVWESMGYRKRDEQLFKNFKVDESLMALAKPEAVFMHCMPMSRGKEVSERLPDLDCSLVFKQSENRLHIQKSLLVKLLS